MTIDGGTQAAVIGVGATTILVLGGGLWKAAGMRGDINNRWKSRVELAGLALDEKTFAALRALHEEMDRLMPPKNAPFDPSQEIQDPSTLSDAVEKTADYYQHRVKMDRQLGALLSLGRVAVGSLAALITAIALLSLYYSQIAHWGAARWAGFVIGTVGLIGGLLVVAVYVYCLDQLAGSEELAGTAGRAGGDGG